MSTQILNLTPHEINIGTASIKPFGVVARVYVESISDGEFTTASGTTIPITKTNTVSCSATKTCAAYKPVPQSPAKP